MTATNPDADLRRRSAFRILLPPVMFVGVIAAATLVRIYYGSAGAGALVLSGGVGLIALWALYDGGRRAFGHPTYLGTGQGLDRLFGLVQAAITIGIALALLPNTIRLLNFLARLATGGVPPALR
ncbi:MAG: hypothetical protein ACRDI2_16845 [Chloroflexota bacterium]